MGYKTGEGANRKTRHLIKRGAINLSKKKWGIEGNYKNCYHRIKGGEIVGDWISGGWKRKIMEKN